MKNIALEGELQKKVAGALSQSALFRAVGADQLGQVIALSSLVQYEVGEQLTVQGDPSDAFFLLLRGEVSVRLSRESAGSETVEVARLRPGDTVGEMGVLLGQPRSATVVADAQTLVLRYESTAFQAMFQRIPGFGLALCRVLASRLAKASRDLPVPDAEGSCTPDPDVAGLLPVEVQQRYRMVPLKASGSSLVVGFVDDPNPHALAAIRQHAPGMQVRVVRMPESAFEQALNSRQGAELRSSSSHQAQPRRGARSSPKLDALLRRMVAEGASDLHLSAGQPPRWRIDGDIKTLGEGRLFGENEVLELLLPVLEERNRIQFERDNDTDFAYALPGTARFRTNLFRDHHGVGVVMRQIPDKILTFEQLGLPPVTKWLCDMPKGLVLVTGPTGSGKSTTLAAMIDQINRTRPAHVITLEDPIEFVHESRACLVNQREVGPHTTGFARALRAALREDPDIVLVGEMRDLETVSLALETANTGHLVFGTLHTATAISTVDRIINLYPSDQHNQVRSTLADVLRGVIAQTLCRRVGGGRIAALEILVSNFAVANLIREGKTHQIASSMSTGKAAGNQMLNDELARLVAERKVEFEEAMSKAVDKADLAKRCGKDMSQLR